MHDTSPAGNLAGPYDEMSRMLAGLPRPRPVRMSRRGKLTAGAVSIALLASLGIFAAGMVATSAAAGRNARQPQFLTFALPIVLVFLVVPLMLRTLGRQKFLLAEGDWAAGRVTKRWAARNGPNVKYEFTTPLGEHFSRSAADGSGRLAIGMNVPVFYDPQSPKKQLALCASFYEVILAGENNTFGA
jgi:hypothetical protein